MRRYSPLLLLLLLFSSGCSLFTVGGTKIEKAKIPLKPEVPWEMKDGLQQSADVADQIADVAVQSGLSANSLESKTLKEQTDTLTLVLGKPTQSIPYADHERTEKLAEDLKRMEQERREADRKWESAIDALAYAQDSNRMLSEKNSSLWTWIVVMGIALGILVFVFPTIGVPIVFWLIKRAKSIVAKTGEEALGLAKEQFSQVVLAVEDHKKILKDRAPEEYERLRNQLRQYTDTDTRRVIEQLLAEKKK